jgi:HlyD family secretion protein
MILAGLAVAALVGGFFWYRSRHSDKGIAVSTEKAVMRTITQVVTATGKIQPEVEVKITSEVYGEITELPFQEGDAVKKGDLIVRIKPDLYQASVDQQTAAVSMARSAAIASHAAMDKAESDLKRYKDLHDRQLASDADYILYKTNYESAKANYVSAVANVQEAEGLLNQARESLTQTVIRSPMDGAISLLNSQVGESVVAQSSFTGTEILRVADLSHMEVQVNVNENDIPNVKLGDPVVISIDAYPDRKFKGVVREIGASAANTGATSSGTAAQASSSSSDEVTNFLVKIRVSDRDVQLRPGMSATADIQTQTVENVVAVPIQSVTVRDAGGLTSEQVEERQAQEDQEKSGNAASAASARDEDHRARDLLQRVVFIRKGNKVRLQAVDTGVADTTWIEIKRGVQPGDEIVSGSYAAISRMLKDGSVVQNERPKKEIVQN